MALPYQSCGCIALAVVAFLVWVGRRLEASSRLSLETHLRQLSEEVQQGRRLAARLLEREAGVESLQLELAETRARQQQLEAEVQGLATAREGAFIAGEALTHARLHEERLQAELHQVRQALNEAQRQNDELVLSVEALARDCRKREQEVQRAALYAEEIRGSLTFRLGSAIIESLHSWRGFTRLGGRLVGFVREGYGRGARPVTAIRTRETAVELKAFLDAAYAGGMAAVEPLVSAAAPDDVHHQAAIFSDLCVAARSVSLALAVELARAAHRRDPSPSRSKLLAFLLYEVGALFEPAALLETLPQKMVAAFRRSEANRATLLGGQLRLAQNIDIPKKQSLAYKPRPRKVFYVAASTLPHHLSGYTLRTDSLIKEIRGGEWDVELVSRCGYPLDRPDRLPPEAQKAAGSVVPEPLAGPSLRETPYDIWLESAVNLLVRKAKADKPCLIHAASNWENALPALIAARRLGLPFVYEVRGFWELTKASRHPEWDGSEQYRLAQSMEAMIAAEADGVVTLSPRMRAELDERCGAALSTVCIAPNGARTGEHEAVATVDVRQQFGISGDAFLVAYVGSILDYEGCDLLVSAIATLRAAGCNVHALMAGDGNALNVVRTAVRDAGLEEHVSLPGRVPPTVAESILVAADVVVIPRRDYRVTATVEPLKLAEAMSLGKPLVVSSVGALTDVVTDGKTGLVFQAGDAADLASVLGRLAGDRVLAASLGQAARAFSIEERNWTTSSRRIVELWDVCCAQVFDDALAEQRAEQVLAQVGDILAQPEEVDVRAFIRRNSRMLSVPRQAKLLIKCARLVRRVGDSGLELALLREATEDLPGAMTWRALAQSLWHYGWLDEAEDVLSHLRTSEGDAGHENNERLRVAIAQRRSLMAADDHLLASLVGKTAPMGLPIDRKVLYFLHFSLPHASNGYATRSHGLIRGIKANGYDVAGVRRWGFPYDQPGFKGGVVEREIVDDVVYHAVGARPPHIAEIDSVLRAADLYEALIREERPRIIHAASNYVTALPALVAARRAGLPFLYEVRGFWEMTRATRTQEFDKCPHFEMMRALEALVARHADQVVTLTQSMALELVERGVPSGRIVVVPNAVDTEKFAPLQRDEDLARELGLAPGVPVIGYVGSVVGYEGLDDLVLALAQLRDEGIPFYFVLVGDGLALRDLRCLIDELGLAERVRAPGRLPHNAVVRYYSLMDVCPFPRKPLPLCEMVSPLKPLEAMAMAKAVVSSDVAALREMVVDGQTGLLSRKGDVSSLRDVIRRMVMDRDLRIRLGASAREWVLENRNWDKAGSAVAQLYGSMATIRPQRST